MKKDKYTELNDSLLESELKRFHLSPEIEQQLLVYSTRVEYANAAAKLLKDHIYKKDILKLIYPL